MVVGHSAPAYGQLYLLSFGHFVYVPGQNFVGEDWFTYTVNDGAEEATASVRITITNQAPSAADNTYTVHQGETLDTRTSGLASLLANDGDPDGNQLFISSYSSPANGFLTISPDGHLVYTPAAGFAGTDSFSYDVSDGVAGATAFVTMTVANESPVALGESFTVSQNHRLNSDAQGLASLLANDTDLDGDILSIASFTQPAHGTVNIDAFGHFTFDTEPGWTGIDGFTYVVTDGVTQASASVTLQVTADNAALWAHDDSYTVARNGILDSRAQELPSLLDNDDNPGNDWLQTDVTVLPAHGSLTLDSEGHFVYQPIDGYVGPDSFTYQITDGVIVSSAAVSLTVGNGVPVAPNASYVALVGETLHVTDLVPAAPDPDGDPVTAVLVDAPVYGQLTFNADGSFDYTPGDHLGPVTFTYKLNDGAEDGNVATVTINVTRQVTWTGAADGVSWNNPDNWDTAFVPNEYAVVIIPTGATVAIPDAYAAIAYALQAQGNLNNAGSLTLLGNSSIAGTFATVGQLTLEAGVAFQVNGQATLAGTIALGPSAALELHNSTDLANNLAITGSGFLIIADGAVATVLGLATVARTEQRGGTLTGTGNFVVSDSYVWLGGALQDAGTVTVAADGWFVIDGEDPHSLSGRTLYNEGRLDWLSDADVEVLDGVLDNQADMYVFGSGRFQGNLSVRNAGTLYRQEYGDALWNVQLFENTGTLSVEKGSLQLVGGTFRNSGIVNVQDATLRIASDGLSTGQFNVTAAEGVLEFALSHALQGPINSVGSVVFSGGTISVLGAYQSQITSIAQAEVFFAQDVSLPKLQLGFSGVLTGPSKVTITSQMTWTAGCMDGGGITEIAPGATLVISQTEQGAAGTKTLGSAAEGSRDLNNFGTILWYDGNVSLVGSNIDNRGIFKALGDDSLLGDDESSFSNSGGDFRKLWDEADPNAVPPTTTDQNISRLGLTVLNNGTIEVHTGRLALTHSTTNLGTVNIAASAYLDVEGVFAFERGTITGGGAYVSSENFGVVALKNQGEFQVNADLTVAALEVAAGGKISGPATLVITGYLDWNGGDMIGNGTTKIEESAILLVNNGDNSKQLRDRVIDNHGRVAWSAPGRQIVVTNSVGTYVLGNANDVPEQFNQRSGNAGNRFTDDVEAERGPIVSAEEQADVEYSQREAVLADAYAQAVAHAESEYDANIALAEAERAQAPPDDLEADERYWDQVAAAEEARDQAIEKAGEKYYEEEQLLYNGYQSSLESATRIFQTGLASALATFRQRLWNAAHQAQPDLLAAHYGRAPGFRTIDQLAEDVYNLLRGAVPDRPLPPGHAGNGHPPTVGYFLTSLTADVRASLMNAYQRRYSVPLLNHIDFFRSGTPRIQARNALLFGQLQTIYDPAEPLTIWEHVGVWVNDAASWMGNAWQSTMTVIGNFASGIGDAWTSVTDFVVNSATQFVTDPLGFVQNVGVGLINTATVAANTMTFGLIPTLNQHAQELVANNGFYRFVQITSVIGREIVLGMATGGVANLAVGGAIRAGRIAGQLLTRVGAGAVPNAVARVAPALACRLTTAQRLAQPFQTISNVSSMANNFIQAQQAMEAGDHETAAALMARSAGMIPGTLGALRETMRFARAASTLNADRIRGYLNACFAAGTPILWEGGEKAIEEFKVGERVWARDEFDPNGPLELKEIEQYFVRTAALLHLHVGEHVIRTTDEHPFWVVDKGWTKAIELHPGDSLLTHDGRQVAVEEVLDTGEWETVYNFRVADFHTYFVGSSDWGFDVWAHNTCNIRPRLDPANRGRIKTAFAEIRIADLNSGTPTNPAARAFTRSLQSNPGDDAGHIIGRLLGGPAVPNNLFPQLSRVNRGAFAVFERSIAAQVRAGRQVFVRVKLEYASPTDLRPTRVIYQVRVDGVSWTPQPFNN